MAKRNTCKCFSLAACALLGLALSACGAAKEDSHTYVSRMRVFNVSENFVSVVDYTDNVWWFSHESGSYAVGETLVVTLDNMGTDSIYDDEIVSVE